MQADRSTNALTEYVEFKDTNLKKCVVEELALQDEDSDVSKELLAEITELQCRSRGIIDIAALEHATNLTSLDLEANEILDASPLAAPTNLELLDLHDRRISLADAVSGVPFTVPEVRSVDGTDVPVAIASGEETFFGSPTDNVLIGDWNNDGVDTPAVRSENIFSIFNNFAGGNAVIELMLGDGSETVYVAKLA